MKKMSHSFFWRAFVPPHFEKGSPTTDIINSIIFQRVVLSKNQMTLLEVTILLRRRFFPDESTPSEKPVQEIAAADSTESKIFTLTLQLACVQTCAVDLIYMCIKV